MKKGQTLILLSILIVLAINSGAYKSEQECLNRINSAEKYIRTNEMVFAGIDYRAAAKCYNELKIKNGTEYFMKSIELCEKEYNRSKEYYGAECLGDTYDDMGDHDNAVEWYKKSCEANKVQNMSCAGDYVGIAIAYAHKGDKENACYWCDKANEDTKGFWDCKFVRSAEYKTRIVCHDEASSNPISSSTEALGNVNGGSLFVILIVVIVLIVAVVFLVRRRRKK
jgi:tetratricopeptide (TPR) repeat protein